MVSCPIVIAGVGPNGPVTHASKEGGLSYQIVIIYSPIGLCVCACQVIGLGDKC